MDVDDFKDMPREEENYDDFKIPQYSFETSDFSGNSGYTAK
jgi:hypothetical protein